MKKYQIIKPDYYERFTCKGGTCRQSCCKGWSITLSKEDARKLKGLLHTSPEFADKAILERIPTEERTKGKDSRIILDENDRCPLLDSQGLCNLQRQYGPGALSDTCRFFPRMIYRYQDTLLYTVSPGCEKVLEILLDSRKGINLDSCSHYFRPDFPIKTVFNNGMGNNLLIGMHFDIINLWMVMLQANDVVIEDRIILLGVCLRQVETMIQEKKFMEIHGYIDNFLRSLEGMENADSLLPEFESNPLVVLNNLLALDAVHSSSRDVCLEQMWESLEVKKISSADGSPRITYSSSAYADMKKKYQTFMQDKDYFIENYMLCFFLYKNYASTSASNTSLWNNYLYFSWFFSIVKFSITACMSHIKTNEDFIDHLIPLIRKWGHNVAIEKAVLEDLHDNSNDTLAHAAFLIKSC